jgi:zinc resistance-associated protein
MIDARPYCPLHGSYNWRCNETLAEEQRTQLKGLYQNFYDDTVTLRNELRTKARQLSSLLNASDPDAEEVRSILREVSDLEAKTAEKKLDLELEARKIAPEVRFGGSSGYGNHMGGYGNGMGYAQHMRSDTPGVCWN